MTKVVSVVAAVITPQGLTTAAHAPLGPNINVLLAQRPEGKHLAGKWEFPGGQVESGESHENALYRELDEELGIQIQSAHPWTTITHPYPEKTVILHIYRVTEWSGVASGREGQAIEWVAWHQVQDRPMPEADRALIKAFGMSPFGLTLSLPNADRDLLEYAQERLDWIAKSAWSHHPWWIHLALEPDSAHRAHNELASLIALIKDHGHVVMVHGTVDVAAELKADGVYLHRQAGLALTERPREFKWVAMACDDRQTLAHAGDLGLDYVTLAPLRRPHHAADTAELGGEQFKQLLTHASLPVLALGGLGLNDLTWVRSLGGFGIASTTGFVFDKGAS